MEFHVWNFRQPTQMRRVVRGKVLKVNVWLLHIGISHIYVQSSIPNVRLVRKVKYNFCPFAELEEETSGI